MNTIIKHNEYIIKQDTTDQKIYTIFFNFYSEILIKSIIKPKLIKGATTTQKYNTITFKADSVTKYKNTNQYAKALQLVSDLATQLEYLINDQSHTFIGYTTENIIVIDGSRNIYISNDQLKEIDEEDQIMITSPFSQNDFFMSPELKKITEIPWKTHYKTSYYSLGCLILESLTDKQEKTTTDKHADIETDRNRKKEKDIDIQHIKGTKLYGLLKRCLIEEAKNRSIIFI
jgi:hypothetical protein